MKSRSPADNTYERGKRPKKATVLCAKAPRQEDKMSGLHMLIPIFLAVQFVLVLIALVAATLFADPDEVIPTGKSLPRDPARSTWASRG